MKSSVRTSEEFKTATDSSSYVTVTTPRKPSTLLVSEVRAKASTRTRRAKRVWIDLDNSPHVPFFLPIVDELKKRGIDVTLTARDAYQVRELLEFYKIQCRVIGGHTGKSKLLKVLVNCARAVQLAPIVAKVRPDLGLSHGSRAQVLICKAFNIPTTVIHDYEFTTKTGFLEPDWTMMPDIIPVNAMSKHADRVTRYPGLKEDVYVPRFRPDPCTLRELKIAGDPLIAMLRPPADEAHYHNPESDVLFAEVVRFLGTQPNVVAVTLPRNERQERRLRSQWGALIESGKMIIPDHPLDGLNLVWFSDLVVSGGGTMNREAAALGVPVYSVFRGKIGAVDQYLVREGRLTLIEKLEDVRKKIRVARWNRPIAPDSQPRPALSAIVQHVISKLNARHTDV
jgi:predicted glycosyltransferase